MLHCWTDLALLRSVPITYRIDSNSNFREMWAQVLHPVPGKTPLDSMLAPVRTVSTGL